MRGRDRIIGVDFDNTIISYDKLLQRLAADRGLIPVGMATGKKTIRDSVRLLPRGEIEWQKLQAAAYGPRIGEAEPAEGVRRFFELGRRRGVRMYIISHKTEFANYGDAATNLRTAALDWMAANRFFAANGLGLSQDDVFFGAARSEKIGFIRRLGCTHFIDDLEETFLEDTFPAGVEKVLYAPHGAAVPYSGLRVMSNWREICDYFFADDN